MSKKLLLPLFTVAAAVIGFASATTAHAAGASQQSQGWVQPALTRADVRAQAVRAMAMTPAAR